MRVIVGAEPPGVFLAEELEARGWSSRDLALRMGGDAAVNELCVDMMIAVHDPNLLVDAETSAQIGRALDVSEEFFLNLDRLYRRSFQAS